MRTSPVRGFDVEKYSVVQDQSNEKTASKGCPVCGAEPEVKGGVKLCPVHGSEPWEKQRKHEPSESIKYIGGI